MNAQSRIRAVIWDLDGVILRQGDQPGLANQPAFSLARRHPAMSGRSVDYDLLAFVRAMRSAVHTALLVNSWAEVWQIVGLRDALAPSFDRVIHSADTGLARSDERIFNVAAVRLGAAPSQTVLVDADPGHIRAARRAGLQAVRFESPAQAGSELMELLLEPVN